MISENKRYLYFFSKVDNFLFPPLIALARIYHAMLYRRGTLFVILGLKYVVLHYKLSQP